MNINQTINGLMESFKSLVYITKPKFNTENGWIDYVEVDGLKLSVQAVNRVGYVFLITREPDLAMKVRVTTDYRIYDTPEVFGDVGKIHNLVINAIRSLESKL